MPSCCNKSKNKVVGSLEKSNPESYANVGQLNVNVIRYGQCKDVKPIKRDLVKRTRRRINYGDCRQVNKLPNSSEPECPPNELPVKVIKPLICPCPKEGCCSDE